MNWKRAKNVVWEELEGGALLVNAKTGARCSLNASAAALWKLCDGALSLGELAARVARPCAEVAQFCDGVARLGLLAPAAQPVPAPASGSASFRLAPGSAPQFTLHGLGAGPRRRPSPTGSSGPA